MERVKSKLSELGINPGDILEVIINKDSKYSDPKRNHGDIPQYEPAEKMVTRPGFKRLGYYIDFNGSSLIISSALNVLEGPRYPINMFAIDERCIYEFRKL